MQTRFELAGVLETIYVVSTRVLPTVFFTPTAIYDAVIALNPVVTAFYLTCILACAQVLLSIVTCSYAWNDRFWSLAPPIFSLLYALHAPLSGDLRTGGQIDPRLALMSALVVVWGLRLTFNAARRGFYGIGFVDPRYEWIRENWISSQILFAITYAAFSCGLMTVLLALLCAPLYPAWVARGTPLNFLDAAAAVGMTLAILLETIADNQQASFQARKAAWLALPSDKRVEGSKHGEQRELREGFLQSGLFARSRHPNFFAEVSVWWCFYLFSVAATGVRINWTISGAVAYTLLFQFTTPLTEHISAAKYPAYAEYQKRVSRLIPISMSTWKDPPHYSSVGAKED